MILSYALTLAGVALRLQLGSPNRPIGLDPGGILPLKPPPKRREADVDEITGPDGELSGEFNEMARFCWCKTRPLPSALQGLCQAFIVFHAALDLFDKRLHAFFDSRPE